MLGALKCSEFESKVGRFETVVIVGPSVISMSISTIDSNVTAYLDLDKPIATISATRSFILH